METKDNECVKCGKYSGGATLCRECEKKAIAKLKRKKKGSKMKTLMLALVFLTQAAQAGTADHVESKFCLPSFQYGMVVTGKHGNQILVTQVLAGLSEMGVVELDTSKVTTNGIRLNILVRYKGTKLVTGADGFNHVVDFWVECHKMYPEAQPL